MDEMSKPNLEAAVAIGLDELAKEVVVLHETVGSIEGRLAWVCVPLAGTATPKKTRDTDQSALLERIHHVTETVMWTRERLLALMDAMQV